MHALVELLPKLSQLGSHTHADRRSSHGKSPHPVLPIDMFEAQEVERLGFLAANRHHTTKMRLNWRRRSGRHGKGAYKRSVIHHNNV